MHVYVCMCVSTAAEAEAEAETKADSGKLSRSFAVNRDTFDIRTCTVGCWQSCQPSGS